MSNDRKDAANLMAEAIETITNKRPGVHGSAEDSFRMIAELWTTYLRHTRLVRSHDQLLPEDIAQMMSILKKCRAVYGDPSNADNFVDDLGYTALAGMMQLPTGVLGVPTPTNTRFEPKGAKK
jgi:hypothetical protein